MVSCNAKTMMLFDSNQSFLKKRFRIFRISRRNVFSVLHAYGASGMQHAHLFNWITMCRKRVNRTLNKHRRVNRTLNKRRALYFVSWYISSDTDATQPLSHVSDSILNLIISTFITRPKSKSNTTLRVYHHVSCVISFNYHW